MLVVANLSVDHSCHKTSLQRQPERYTGDIDILVAFHFFLVLKISTARVDNFVSQQKWRQDSEFEVYVYDLSISFSKIL